MEVELELEAWTISVGDRSFVGVVGGGGYRSYGAGG